MLSRIDIKRTQFEIIHAFSQAPRVCDLMVGPDVSSSSSSFSFVLLLLLLLLLLHAVVVVGRRCRHLVVAAIVVVTLAVAVVGRRCRQPLSPSASCACIRARVRQAACPRRARRSRWNWRRSSRTSTSAPEICDFPTCRIFRFSWGLQPLITATENFEIRVRVCQAEAVGGTYKLLLTKGLEAV